MVQQFNDLNLCKNREYYNFFKAIKSYYKYSAGEIFFALLFLSFISERNPDKMVLSESNIETSNEFIYFRTL